MWSSVYTFYYVKSGAYDGLNIWGVITQWIEGPYHFWYLYAIIGLYALTPLLRKITEDEKKMLYFLVLFAAKCNSVLNGYLCFLCETSVSNQLFSKSSKNLGKAD